MTAASETLGKLAAFPRTLSYFWREESRALCQHAPPWSLFSVLRLRYGDEGRASRSNQRSDVCRGQTDGQTDRQTDRMDIAHNALASSVTRYKQSIFSGRFAFSRPVTGTTLKS